MSDNRIFVFNKPDSNDIKHAIIGLLGYLAVFGMLYLITVYSNFDLSLRPHELALMATFAAAFIWEFAQMWISKAKIDFKDILVSCLPGLIVSIVLWI